MHACVCVCVCVCVCPLALQAFELDYPGYGEMIKQAMEMRALVIIARVSEQADVNGMVGEDGTTPLPGFEPCDETAPATADVYFIVALAICAPVMCLLGISELWDDSRSGIPWWRVSFWCDPLPTSNPDLSSLLVSRQSVPSSLRLRRSVSEATPLNHKA